MKYIGCYAEVIKVYKFDYKSFIFSIKGLNAGSKSVKSRFQLKYLTSVLSRWG
jgi:hypothetical protein